MELSFVLSRPSDEIAEPCVRCAFDLQEGLVTANLELAKGIFLRSYGPGLGEPGGVPACEPPPTWTSTMMQWTPLHSG